MLKLDDKRKDPYSQSFNPQSLLSPSADSSLLLRCGIEIDFESSQSSGDWFDYDIERLKRSVYEEESPQRPPLMPASLQQAFLPSVSSATEYTFEESKSLVQGWSRLFGWNLDGGLVVDFSV